jgi:hypothetical protein
MHFALLDTGVTRIGIDRVFLTVQQFGYLVAPPRPYIRYAGQYKAWVQALCQLLTYCF